MRPNKDGLFYGSTHTIYRMRPNKDDLFRGFNKDYLFRGSTKMTYFVVLLTRSTG